MRHVSSKPKLQDDASKIALPLAFKFGRQGFMQSLNLSVGPPQVCDSDEHCVFAVLYPSPSVARVEAK
jgi:hypothetical protein